MKNQRISKQAWILFSIFFTTVTTSHVTAQETSLSFGAARSFGINGVTHPLFEQSEITGSVTSATAKRVTPSTGYNVRWELNHYLNEYVGIGFHGTLIRGNWQHFSSERKIVFVQHTARSIKCNGFSLAANLLVRFPNEYVSPYFSLMPGFFSGYLDIHDTVTYSEALTASVWKYTGMNSFFLGMVAGADIHLNDHLALFVQAELINFTTSPQRGRLITRNGSDFLDNIPTSEKRIVFVEHMSSDYNQLVDESLPTQILKPYFNHDSFQLRIGFRVVFGYR